MRTFARIGVLRATLFGDNAATVGPVRLKFGQRSGTENLGQAAAETGHHVAEIEKVGFPERLRTHRQAEHRGGLLLGITRILRFASQDYGSIVGSNSPAVPSHGVRGQDSVRRAA